MNRLVLAPIVFFVALVLVALTSLAQHDSVQAEPVPYATPSLPGITPTAASAGLLALVPTRTPTSIPVPVQNFVVPAATPVPYRAPASVPELTVCGLSGPEYRQAGEQTIVIGAIAGAPPGQEGGFVFDLPPGDFIVARILRNNVTTVQVCDLYDASTLVLARTNGAEISRSARSIEAAQAFNYLVGSIRPPSCVFGCGQAGNAVPVP